MRILVVYQPCRESAIPTLPRGLLSVALIKDGHTVKFLDITMEKPNREEVIAKIKSEKFDLMIIRGIITTYGYIKWLTNEVKKIHPDIPILGDGFVATPIPHIIFRYTGIDVICNGEGDITVREYVSTLENGGDVSMVQGLFLKNGASFLKTPERPMVKNLDKIFPPLDSYKLLDIERYIVENEKSIQSVLELCEVWISHLTNFKLFCFFQIIGIKRFYTHNKLQ